LNFLVNENRYLSGTERNGSAQGGARRRPRKRRRASDLVPSAIVGLDCYSTAIVDITTTCCNVKSEDQPQRPPNAQGISRAGRARRGQEGSGHSFS